MATIHISANSRLTALLKQQSVLDASNGVATNPFVMTLAHPQGKHQQNLSVNFTSNFDLIFSPTLTQMNQNLVINPHLC